MDISFIIIIAIFLLTIPISWLEINTYKKAIKSWRELEPATYQEAGGPSEYLELSNLRIKYTFIMSFDYLRTIQSPEVKDSLKKYHAFFIAEHLTMLSIVLCAIYC